MKEETNKETRLRKHNKEKRLTSTFGKLGGVIGAHTHFCFRVSIMFLPLFGFSFLSSFSIESRQFGFLYC